MNTPKKPNNNQSKSDRQFQSGVNKIFDGITSPLRATGEVFTQDDATKPTRTVLNGIGSIASGLVDLSLSFASSVAESATTTPKPKRVKPSLADFPQHRAKYASLLKPIEKEVRIDPNKPVAYWSHLRTRIVNGEEVTIELPYTVRTCHQEYCEGVGEFIFTEAQEAKYDEYNMDYPAACDPCKDWRYIEECKGDRYQDCELCGKAHFVTFKSQISYHKNEGYPRISRFCDCEERAREQAEKDKQL